MSSNATHTGLTRKLRSVVGVRLLVLARRVRLWGIGGFFATIIVLGGATLIVVEPDHILAQLSAVNVGICGTLASVAYALAFFRPGRYLERIRSRPIANATQG